MLGPPSLRITVNDANPLLARVSRAKSLDHSAQSRRASGGKGETGNILESWDMDLRWIKRKQLAVSTALENTTRLTHWYPLMLVSCIDLRAIHWCKLDTTTYQNTQIIKRTIQMHQTNVLRIDGNGEWYQSFPMFPMPLSPKNIKEQMWFL